MNKKINIFISFLVVIVISLISYFIGYKKAYDDYERDSDSNKLSYHTFYATITDIKDTGLSIDNTALTVKGLEINGINFRGDFEFIITEDTELEWRNTNIKTNELEIGDNISIIFTGEIQETDPARIEDVLKIQLLDDEK